MKMAFIIRGPSGAGKSTLVKHLKQIHENQGLEVVVCSADDFFMKSGEYQFDPRKLGEAHAKCMQDFLYAIAAKKQVIIVDNTNIHQWEWSNYALVAKMAKYNVEIQEFRVKTLEEARIIARRNVHRVPEDIVLKMFMEFEPCENAVTHQVFK